MNKKQEWTVEWHTPFGTEDAEQWCSNVFEPGTWRVYNKPVLWEITPITLPVFAFTQAEYAVLFTLKWKSLTRKSYYD